MVKTKKRTMRSRYKIKIVTTRYVRGSDKEYYMYVRGRFRWLGLDRYGRVLNSFLGDVDSARNLDHAMAAIDRHYGNQVVDRTVEVEYINK